ncbi:unnamed protein product, partial [Ectocarpus sp. 12 AP-2014]
MNAKSAVGIEVLSVWGAVLAWPTHSGRCARRSTPGSFGNKLEDAIGVTGVGSGAPDEFVLVFYGERSVSSCFYRVSSPKTVLLLVRLVLFSVCALGRSDGVRCVLFV